MRYNLLCSVSADVYHDYRGTPFARGSPSTFDRSRGNRNAGTVRPPSRIFGTVLMFQRTTLIVSDTRGEPTLRVKPTSSRDTKTHRSVYLHVYRRDREKRNARPSYEFTDRDDNAILFIGRSTLPYAASWTLIIIYADTSRNDINTIDLAQPSPPSNELSPRQLPLRTTDATRGKKFIYQRVPTRKT